MVNSGAAGAEEAALRNGSGASIPLWPPERHQYGRDAAATPTYKPETDWRRNLEGGLRTGLSTLLTLIWAQFGVLRHQLGFYRFFTVIVTVVVYRSTLGEVIAESLKVVQGGIFAYVITSVARAICGKDPYAIGFGIFVSIFLITRARRLSPLARKLSSTMVLMGLLTFRDIAYPGEWFQRVALYLFTFPQGGFFALIVNVIPYPRFAVREGALRAQYSCQVLSACFFACVLSFAQGRDERAMAEAALLSEQLKRSVARLETMQHWMELEIVVFACGFWRRKASKATQALQRLVEVEAQALDGLEGMRKALDGIGNTNEHADFLEYLGEPARDVAMAVSVVCENAAQQVSLTELWKVIWRSDHSNTGSDNGGGNCQSADSLNVALSTLGEALEHLVDEYDLARVRLLYGVEEARTARSSAAAAAAANNPRPNPSSPRFESPLVTRRAAGNSAQNAAKAFGTAEKAALGSSSGLRGGRAKASSLEGLRGDNAAAAAETALALHLEVASRKGAADALLLRDRAFEASFLEGAKGGDLGGQQEERGESTLGNSSHSEGFIRSGGKTLARSSFVAAFDSEEGHEAGALQATTAAAAAGRRENGAIIDLLSSSTGITDEAGAAAAGSALRERAEQPTMSAAVETGFSATQQLQENDNARKGASPALASNNNNNNDNGGGGASSIVQHPPFRGAIIHRMKDYHSYMSLAAFVFSLVNVCLTLGQLRQVTEALYGDDPQHATASDGNNRTATTTAAAAATAAEGGKNAEKDSRNKKRSSSIAEEGGSFGAGGGGGGGGSGSSGSSAGKFDLFVVSAAGKAMARRFRRIWAKVRLIGKEVCLQLWQGFGPNKEIISVAKIIYKRCCLCSPPIFKRRPRVIKSDVAPANLLNVNAAGDAGNGGSSSGIGGINDTNNSSSGGGAVLFAHDGSELNNANSGGNGGGGAVLFAHDGESEKESGNNSKNATSVLRRSLADKLHLHGHSGPRGEGLALWGRELGLRQRQRRRWEGRAGRWQRWMRRNHQQLFQPLKLALIITLCSIFALVPALAQKYAPPVWVPFTAVFVMANDSSSGFLTSVNRFTGTVLGSLYGYVIAKIVGIQIGSYTWQLIIFLPPWVAFVCCFRYGPTGYAAQVAAFTSVLLFIGLFVIQTEGNLAPFSRMELTFFGCFIYIAVDNTIAPVRAKSLLRQHIFVALQTFSREVVALENLLFEQPNAAALLTTGNDGNRKGDFKGETSKDSAVFSESMEASRRARASTGAAITGFPTAYSNTRQEKGAELTREPLAAAKTSSSAVKSESHKSAAAPELPSDGVNLFDLSAGRQSGTNREAGVGAAAAAAVAAQLLSGQNGMNGAASNLQVGATATTEAAAAAAAAAVAAATTFPAAALALEETAAIARKEVVMSGEEANAGNATAGQGRRSASMRFDLQHSTSYQAFSSGVAQSGSSSLDESRGANNKAAGNGNNSNNNSSNGGFSGGGSKSGFFTSHHLSVALEDDWRKGQKLLPQVSSQLNSLQGILAAQANCVGLAASEPQLWHRPFHSPSYQRLLSAQEDMFGSMVLLARASTAFRSICSVQRWRDELENIPTVIRELRAMLRHVKNALKDAEGAFAFYQLTDAEAAAVHAETVAETAENGSRNGSKSASAPANGTGSVQRGGVFGIGPEAARQNNFNSNPEKHAARGGAESTAAAGPNPELQDKRAQQQHQQQQQQEQQQHTGSTFRFSLSGGSSLMASSVATLHSLPVSAAASTRNEERMLQRTQQALHLLETQVQARELEQSINDEWLRFVRRLMATRGQRPLSLEFVIRFNTVLFSVLSLQRGLLRLAHALLEVLERERFAYYYA